MQINQLFQSIHGKMTRSDLKPISLVRTNRELSEKIMGNEMPSWEELQKMINHLSVSEDNIFFSPKGLHSLYYYNSPNLVEIPSLKPHILDEMQTKKMIEVRNEMFQKALKEKDYFQIFAFIDSKVDMMFIEEEFDNIPDENKYEIFKHFYTHSEYGFSQFNKELVKKALSFRKEEETKENLNKIVHLKDEEGNITIYRGEGEASSSHENAYSWTTNLNTALFFSGRFDIKGKLLKAKIPFNEIVDYFDDRNEYEVIVFPKDLQNVETLDLVDTEEMMTIINQEGLGHYYQRGWGLLKNKLFHNPKGIHGELHARRVLLNALCIYHLKFGHDEDLDLLTYACSYHDIGRTNDGVDDTHGQKSFQKMRKKRLVPYKKGEENYETLRFMIENHHIHDEKALENISNYNIEDMDRAKMLWSILKDADALDRVRLNDVNEKYFRNKETKKLILFAFHILKNVK